MKTRSWLAVVAAVGGCSLPEWQGRVPPVVARENPCGTGSLTIGGKAALHRRPYLQDAVPAGVTVAWAGMPGDGARVVVTRAEDAERKPLARVVGLYAGRPEAEHERRLELEEDVADYDDSDEGGELDEPDDDEDEDEREDDDDDDDEIDVDADELYLLAAQVRGLPPGEAYCYRLENDRGVLTDWASLTLGPRPDDRRIDRFVVIGDTGNGSRAQVALARQLLSVPMDAILFAGDLAYRSGTYEQLQRRFFDIYADLFAHVPVYAAIGNHDNRTARGRPFEEAFVLPGNERWYSFDLGDVHFVVLDTTQIGATQARWLDRDLGRASRRFTVVLAHHPPFTAARRGPSHGFRRWFVPIIERHHVELVIAGHEHHYERTRAIDGVQYIVTGGGGGRLTRAGRNADTKVALAVHHFVTLAVEGRTLAVEAVDIDGRVIDRVEVRDREDRVSVRGPPTRTGAQ